MSESRSFAIPFGAQAFAGTAAPSHPRDCKPGLNEILVRTVQYGVKPMLFEKDVPVQVRDGTTLYVNVFRPQKAGRYPVVISADIYGKDSINMEVISSLDTRGEYETSAFCAWEAPDPGFWVPNSYVVVKAALRGTSGSGGKIVPLSLQEAEDYYDLIEWAGTRDWSNARVGTAGISYLAMTQWRVAQLNPPHLKAMIPWEGVSDLYREWSFHGGIPETHFSRQWIELQRKRHPGSEIEELNAMEREHPLFDEYWAGKHGRLSDIRVPMYAGAGWATQGLHTRGTIEGFKQAASPHKWLEVHGRKEWEYYYSREAMERQKRFFDCFLKGIDNDWLATPRVRIEVRERFYEGLFHFEDEWPIARTQYTSLYLDIRGRVLTAAAGDEPSSLHYDALTGRCSFDMRFERDTELTGNMKLRLWVAAEGSDDMDLFVGVKKIDRRGREVHQADLNHIENGRVASGWLRVSHRELDPARSTPAQPWLKHARLLKLRPGEIVPVEIELLPSSTLFRAGESLRLVLQGTDVPYEATETLPAFHGAWRYEHRETVNCGQHVIHCGGPYDSHLLVPVIAPRS